MTGLICVSFYIFRFDAFSQNMGAGTSSYKMRTHYLTQVELSQFRLGCPIGKGAFGRVKIVYDQNSKRVYALKYISKSKCILEKAYRNILRERALLEHLEHPFIVNLRYAFQDTHNLV